MSRILDMRRSRLLLIAGALLAAHALPLRAHHSVEDMYDMSRTITLTGVVKKVEWANPHVRLVVDVRGAGDEIATWSVEVKPPNAMARLGLSADALRQDKPISLDIWLAKDGSLSATGRTLRMPDGTVYDVADALGWRRVP
jgi:hypothetical protein